MIGQAWRNNNIKYIGWDMDDPNEKQSANDSFNQLFSNAPWISVILGNLSSRPSKRGGYGTIDQNITVHYDY
ncbi:unnamed protein product [Rotaria sp. Silwood1]|nr:unnamed protein product [Rotaria sp. Silwood1]